MAQVTIPIPNPGGGGKFNISSGDEITIVFDRDGSLDYNAIAFSKETIPKGHFHSRNIIGPYLVDSQAQPGVVTLQFFDGAKTWDCELTITV